MKAVFLDRDGTVTVEKGHLGNPDDLELHAGAADAIRRLREAGWSVFVVTNQSGVARGMFTEEELASVHFRMVAMLGAEGASIDGLYSCPHHPEGRVLEYAVDCDCRKPRPGLILQAAREHGVDLASSVIVGDARRDIDAGRSAGLAACVLVLTGHGAETAKTIHGADAVVADIQAAADWILSVELG